MSGRIAVVVTLMLGCLGSLEAQETFLPRENAVLTDAPQVPPPLTRDHAARVVVNLETVEVKGRLADGVEYPFWTFGGRVPGKFIRVRVGDQVEVHLRNDSASHFAHNLDLHGATGQGGGAGTTVTGPGGTSIFTFKALNPGLYLYHCAMAPVGMHVANGMYGLLLVEPEGGLPRVDREYYVIQSEFYTTGSYGAAGLQGFSMEKALREQADYVVFNGAVGSLSGDHALTATVGETVRLFVADAGPNLVSSFHVIGEIFDRVYLEGGSSIETNVQTTLIPAGGSVITEFTVDVPGTYVLVDHAIFRAFNKGALGYLKVNGPANLAIYSGKNAYLPPPDPAPVTRAAAIAPARTRAERIAAGRLGYGQYCVTCHQADGRGLPGVFPPLAQSDFLNADAHRALGAIVHGLSGEIVVNNVKFNGVMPALRLDDEEIVNIFTYVSSQWGNAGKTATVREVEAVRKEPAPAMPAVH